MRTLNKTTLQIIFISFIGCTDTSINYGLKSKDYQPFSIYQNEIDQLVKNKVNCVANCKEYEFNITHSRVKIDTSFGLAILASGQLIYCGPYTKSVKVMLPLTFFKESRGFDYWIYNVQKNKLFIWTNDGGSYVKSNSESIDVKLFYESSDIREYSMSY